MEGFEHLTYLHEGGFQGHWNELPEGCYLLENFDLKWGISVHGLDQSSTLIYFDTMCDGVGL